jgi:carbamoyltransferase
MKKASYMTLVYDVREGAKTQIPAVVHEDGSCRIQTVSEEDNALYYSLLKQIKEKTGHGVVLNTSFNLNHEPIVESPRQALASFYASGIDVLYLHNYRISK